MLRWVDSHQVLIQHHQTTDKAPRFVQAFVIICLFSASALMFVLLKDYTSPSKNAGGRRGAAKGLLVMEESMGPHNQESDRIANMDDHKIKPLKRQQEVPVPAVNQDWSLDPRVPWWSEDCGGLVEFAERLKSKKSKPKTYTVKEEQDRLLLLKKSIVFLKLWKTGSSSIMNLIFRAGEKYNASFVFPTSDVFVGHEVSSPGNANKCMIGDIMALSITAFSKTDIQKMVVGDPAWVTLLRKPIDVYKSLTRQLKHLELQRLSNATHPMQSNEYHKLQLAAAKDFIGNTPPRGHNVNQMIIDMGLPREYLDNEDAVNRHVEYLSKNLDIVLQAERMDESLIFLRHFMNWDFEDIVGFSHGEEVDNEEPWVSWNTYKNVEFQNWPDRYLYREFKNKMENKMSQLGVHRMDAEVSALKCLRKKAFEICKVQERSANDIKDPLFKPVFTNLKGLYPAILQQEQTGVHLPAWLKSLCTNMCLPEKQYLARLRRQQGCPAAEPLRVKNGSEEARQIKVVT